MFKILLNPPKWNQSDSNRPPYPCKGYALPDELWPQNAVFFHLAAKMTYGKLLPLFTSAFTEVIPAQASKA